MTKTKLFILVGCLCCYTSFKAYSASTQNSGSIPFKLDSIVGYKVNAGGDSVYNSKTVYTYNADSVLAIKNSYSYDSGNGIWKASLTDSSFYTANKKLTKNITYKWINSILGWRPNTKLEHDYVASSKSTTNYTYDTTENKWIFQGKSKVVTDSKSGKTLFSESYYWNRSEYKWIGSQKVAYVYNNSDKKVRDTTYAWNSFTDSWTNDRVVKLYNILEQDSVMLTYQWDDINLKWNIFSKYEAERYTDGTNKFLKDLFCFWNNTSSRWDSAYRSVDYIYGFSIETENYVYATHYPSGISEWMQIKKSKLHYNQENRIDSVLTISYDLNKSVWDTSALASIKFDGSGRVTFEQVYYNYDTITCKFKGGSRYIREFDPLGNTTLNEKYVFDGTVQEWNGSTRNVNTYGNPRTYELYSWDSSGKTWKGVLSQLIYRNADDQNEKVYLYSWNVVDKIWELSGKDFYYYSTYDGTVINSIPQPVINSRASKVSAFPNPVKDFLQLKGGNVNKVEIISLNGSVLRKNQGSKTIDMSSLPSGIYYLKVTVENGAEEYIKIVKK